MKYINAKLDNPIDRPTGKTGRSTGISTKVNNRVPLNVVQTSSHHKNLNALMGCVNPDENTLSIPGDTMAKVRRQLGSKEEIQGMLKHFKINI